ncbi:MAG: hypothetical protein GF398_16700 [Chitinivibrionales bacterium]|nr:hypothetical protein [Chitinivibrionales bacterium]
MINSICSHPCARKSIRWAVSGTRKRDNMAELSALKRQLASARQLGNVVSTMKALAAVNIQHYEKAAAAVDRYHETIHSALHALFRFYHLQLPAAAPVRSQQEIFIVCGAEQAMAGSFDGQLLRYLQNTTRDFGVAHNRIDILSFGSRIAASLQKNGYHVKQVSMYPGSLKSSSDRVYETVALINKWRVQSASTRITIFYNRPSGAASFNPRHATLFPINASLVKSLRSKQWDSTSIPLLSCTYAQVYSGIIRNMIFTGILRAFIDTMAAENAARLAAMQAAEKNIQERLAELNMIYNRERQSSITSELLDIIAGVEALEGAQGS